MLTNKPNQSSPFNPFQFADIAMNMVETFCAVVYRPVEVLIRPFHGTRYFSIVVIFLSNLMMLFIPIFGAFATGVVSMIPLVHIPVPVGMFSMGSFAKLYFLLSMVHGVRIFLLMIHPAREMYSFWEGPPLPFINLVPKSRSFWATRIIIEPAIVFLAATLLGNAFIFQSGLVTFLQCAAMCGGMLHFVRWYRSWQEIRDSMDTANIAPLMAKLIDNTATEADLAPVHIAKLPSDLPEEIRRRTAVHIARAHSAEAEEQRNG
jgi:hypothetical protein